MRGFSQRVAQILHVFCLKKHQRVSFSCINVSPWQAIWTVYLPFHLQVLQLSHIYFVSSVPEGSSMHIDVSTAMAYIHVSPPTIRTLTACLMSLAPAKVCVAYRTIGKNAFGSFLCVMNILIRIVFLRFLWVTKSFLTLSLPRFHYWISLLVDRQFSWFYFGEFVIGSTDNPLVDIFLYSHHLSAFVLIT